MWLGFVSLFCRPLVSVPPQACGRAYVSRSISIKPGYIASGLAWHSRPVFGQTDDTSV